MRGRDEQLPMRAQRRLPLLVASAGLVQDLLLLRALLNVVEHQSSTRVTVGSCTWGGTTRGSVQVDVLEGSSEEKDLWSVFMNS